MVFLAAAGGMLIVVSFSKTFLKLICTEGRDGRLDQGSL